MSKQWEAREAGPENVVDAGPLNSFGEICIVLLGVNTQYDDDDTSRAGSATDVNRPHMTQQICQEIGGQWETQRLGHCSCRNAAGRQTNVIAGEGFDYEVFKASCSDRPMDGTCRCEISCSVQDSRYHYSDASFPVTTPTPMSAQQVTEIINSDPNHPVRQACVPAIRARSTILFKAESIKMVASSCGQ